MRKLVECVPNFSEGRRAKVIDRLEKAIGNIPSVYLLDRTSDVDHNRSVITFAGAAREVTEAMEAATAVAVEHIDLRVHRGQHPRMGAVDVIPFVPLGETTMLECVELARSFGARLAERFSLPVYLYGKAATRADRTVLSDIRKPQFEGLRESMAEPGRTPDYGPPRVHPSAGAVAVGARPFLIAYNVNLESDDLELAKRIAQRVRERSGGLPRVQALGLAMEDLGIAQVSMNLLDHTVTPMWRVWEEVSGLAEAEGVRVRESELIGMAPVAALNDVADHAAVPRHLPVEARIGKAAQTLRIRGFRVEQVLELQLAAVSRGGGGPTAAGG
ncbi:MAG: glutamate formimidoyltransferase [Chloroflexi bacterium]|nr:glutamate formimidoyltransferase [Chloroflexota bacterium]